MADSADPTRGTGEMSEGLAENRDRLVRVCDKLLADSGAVRIGADHDTKMWVLSVQIALRQFRAVLLAPPQQTHDALLVQLKEERQLRARDAGGRLQAEARYDALLVTLREKEEEIAALLAALREVAHHADDEAGFMVNVRAALASADSRHQKAPAGG